MIPKPLHMPMYWAKRLQLAKKSSCGVPKCGMVKTSTCHTLCGGGYIHFLGFWESVCVCVCVCVDSQMFWRQLSQKGQLCWVSPPFPRVWDAWVVGSRKLPKRQTLVLAYYQATSVLSFNFVMQQLPASSQARFRHNWRQFCTGPLNLQPIIPQGFF